jgi:TPR repeat protein
MKRAADAGFLPAVKEYAGILLRGEGAQRSPELALRAFEGADDDESRYMVGRIWYDGDGVSQKFGRALQSYLRAHEAGFVEATCDLAHMFLHGRGVAVDVPRAVKLYREAAARGCSTADLNLGILYDRGTHVSKNAKLAADYFRRASDAGNVEGMNRWAFYLASGLGGVEKDLEEARRLYQAAADGGCACAQNSLARMLELGQGGPKDEVGAIELYARAAAQGFPRAMVLYAQLCLRGSEGLPGRNYAQARRYLEQCRVKAPEMTEVDGLLAEIATLGCFS